jgi:hypothetical protein
MDKAKIEAKKLSAEQYMMETDTNPLGYFKNI